MARIPQVSMLLSRVFHPGIEPRFPLHLQADFFTQAGATGLIKLPGRDPPDIRGKKKKKKKSNTTEGMS